MNELRSNPFKFGDPVEGRYYLSRPKLDVTVAHFLQNQIPVVLIGPRRFGKTSFVLNLLRKMEKQGYVCIFVDIFNITSHKDFLQQVLRSVTSKRNWSDRLRSWFKSIFKMRPKVQMEWDELNGHPSFGLSIEKSSEADVKDMIQDILSGLDKFGEQIVIAFDEFQKISEINDQGWLEATLRTHMQRLHRTSFLFYRLQAKHHLRYAKQSRTSPLSFVSDYRISFLWRRVYRLDCQQICGCRNRM